MRLFSYLADWLRERRIARLMNQAIAAGNTFQAFQLWAAMYDEIDRRSPAQIDRMERARGLR